MNKSVSLKEITEIIKNKGIMVIIENRVPWNDYGFPINHAEVLNYINDADGDLWDAMVFGYNKQFIYGDHFKTKELNGLLYSPTGNHKLLIKVPYIRGFSREKYLKDIEKYSKEYKKLNNIPLQFLDFTK